MIDAEDLNLRLELTQRELSRVAAAFEENETKWRETHNLANSYARALKRAAEQCDELRAENQRLRSALEVKAHGFVRIQPPVTGRRRRARAAQLGVRAAVNRLVALASGDSEERPE